MFVPPVFGAFSTDAMLSLIHDFPLGLIISAGPDGLQANALPFLPISLPCGEIRLQAHMTKVNPHLQAVTGSGQNTETLVVFKGPDSYISPNYYPSKQDHGRAVPTWNYAMVEARGQITAHSDAAWLRTHVAALSDWQEKRLARTEKGQPLIPWSIEDAPENYIAAQLNAIVGIEMRQVKLEGKFKLSQNKSVADRDGVIAGLSACGGDAAATAAFMKKIENGK